MKSKIEHIKFAGLDAVNFCAGGYNAIVIPEIGCNVIKLENVEKGIDILRTPLEDDIEAFKNRPQVYGIPMLFPPNRIGNATYTKNGKTYNFPKDMKKFGNYIHGILKSQKFQITREEIKEDCVIVEASFKSDSNNNAIFVNFEHEFTCTVTNKLSVNGLEQTVSFTNESDMPMPIGFGYHTPINVPFCKETKAEDYRLKVSAGKRWELTEKILPTEKQVELNDFEKLLRTDGIIPLSRSFEFHTSNQPLKIDGKEYNGAILTCITKDISIYYEVDEQYKHWTLWNNNAEVDYVCPEPMTWMINAPNLSLDDEITGYQEIKPNDTWKASTKIYIK